MPKGARNTFVIGDLAFLSYETSVSDAIRNARRPIKETGVDAVEPEGSQKVAAQIKGIADAGMIVQAHIGFTTEAEGNGRIAVQAEMAEASMEVLADAKALEEAGASSMST